MNKDGKEQYEQKSEYGEGLCLAFASQSADDEGPGLKPVRFRRRHALTDKTKALSAWALSRRVGYLQVEIRSTAENFSEMPRRFFESNDTIPCDRSLFLIEDGSVVIKHSRHDYFVKEMVPGGLFGEMPFLGQTMLLTKAVAGPLGVKLAVMSEAGARDWIRSDPYAVIELIVPRLGEVASDHFRSQFQLHDSRVAALLLDLAGAGDVVEGITQETMGEMIGIYRETVNLVLNELKTNCLIETRNKKIVILDRPALKALSEL